MADKTTKGETHGCIVCGNLYQMLVVYDLHGRFIDCKVMSAGGKRVINEDRPLVACTRHSAKEIENAVARVYGAKREED